MTISPVYINVPALANAVAVAAKPEHVPELPEVFQVTLPIKVDDVIDVALVMIPSLISISPIVIVLVPRVPILIS